MKSLCNSLALSLSLLSKRDVNRPVWEIVDPRVHANSRWMQFGVPVKSIDHALRRSIHRRDRRPDPPYRVHCIRLGSDAHSNKGWLHSSDFSVRQYKSFSGCCYSFSRPISLLESSAIVLGSCFVRVCWESCYII